MTRRKKNNKVGARDAPGLPAAPEKKCIEGRKDANVSWDGVWSDGN